ncbi:hypothetical protein SteCoe_10146 [Stentor coeruleus]|uniref:C2H2-type domain-containing protein n=1 Tax=Stentor coeruleus TaxID=5963 RepID=A0A1R2CG67_9CILI|nr:hypothetical protein SteCoe_10146 [Stentor coeruleus]
MDSYICQFPGCFKQYKNRCNLKRHEEAFHTENKKFQCVHCKKILSSKQNLKEHEFIHTNQTPYVCREPGCGLRFRHGSQHSAHKRIHVAIKNIVNRSSVVSFKLSNIEEDIEEEINPKDMMDFTLPLIKRSQDYILPVI